MDTTGVCWKRIDIIFETAESVHILLLKREVACVPADTELTENLA